MMEEVHPIKEYLETIDKDLKKMVDLGYIEHVPTQNAYGDDPPQLGGSPQFDYTEITPDIDYLLIPDDRGYKKGKMKKSSGQMKESSRMFVFKNNILYWWAVGDEKKDLKDPLARRPKPKGSIRFDPRAVNNEAKNPKLTYAIACSITNKTVIKIVTDKKTYDLRPEDSKETGTWHKMLNDSLQRQQRDGDSAPQIRPRRTTKTESNDRETKRISLVSMRSHEKSYKIKIMFD
eukprot:UN34150